MLTRCSKEEAMQTELIKPVIPSDDKRWKMVNATMRKHGYHPQALIEVLHSVQEMFGYLDDEAFAHCPLMFHWLYGGNFTFFKMKPQDSIPVWSAPNCLLYQGR